MEQTLILQYIRPGHISPSLHARDDQDYEHDDGDEKCYNIKNHNDGDNSCSSYGHFLME